MNEQWCVLLKHGTGYVVYGPLSEKDAHPFSKFLGDTVDPAIVLPLASPTGEMLAWYQSELDRNNAGEGGPIRWKATDTWQAGTEGAPAGSSGQPSSAPR